VRQIVKSLRIQRCAQNCDLSACSNGFAGIWLLIAGERDYRSDGARMPALILRATVI
jgi:hypothetical protein